MVMSACSSPYRLSGSLFSRNAIAATYEWMAKLRIAYLDSHGRVPRRFVGFWSMESSLFVYLRVGIVLGLFWCMLFTIGGRKGSSNVIEEGDSERCGGWEGSLPVAFDRCFCWLLMLLWTVVRIKYWTCSKNVVNVGNFFFYWLKVH